jgi:ABC-type glycerol-3-phosphate transport system permease component
MRRDTAKLEPTARLRSRRQVLRGDWFQWVCRAFLAIWVIVEVIPLTYVVGISLSTPRDVGNAILYVLPRYPTFANYLGIFDFFNTYLVSFWRLLLNTGIYTVFGLLGSLLAASLASFAFATMEFRGKGTIMYLLLLALITPAAMLMIPEFVTIKTLGLQGGYYTLILPYIAFGLPLPVLILTTFLRELPKEIFDSARVDGCGNFSLFRYIAMPMAQPAVASCVIFLFLGLWNEFPLALIAISDPQLMNVPVALASLAQGRADAVPWPLLATAIVIGSVPVTVVFVLFQGRLVQGLSEGAVKG